MTINKDVYLKTDTNKKLYSLLKNIWDNEEFTFGIMDYCETDELQQRMIDIIESGVDNRNEICLWAISLYRKKDINQLKAKWL